MQGGFPDQLIHRMFHSVAKPTKPSLDELRRCTNEAEVVAQFYRRCAISVPHVKNAGRLS